MGAWLQINERSMPSAEKPKGLLPRWLVTLQKKDYFCDGQVFSIDRDLLMGACIANLEFF
jgi:hypothetical protein